MSHNRTAFRWDSCADWRGTNVDLDVDYSTSFGGDQRWTEWAWDNYQTFVARGASVRGITWRMAGSG